MKKIKILIVDDHQIMIDGLMALLANDKQMQVVGVALNGVRALEIIKEQEIDVVLSDISMPVMDGLALTKAIKNFNENVKVIALSMFCDNENITQMIEAGVSGYLLKNTGNKELTAAIQKVADGGIYYSEEVSNVVIKNFSDHTQKKAVMEKINLTEREKQIIHLIAKEYNNAKIADELFISERTVETHRKNIYRKTNTNSIVGLIKFAYEHGFMK
jgi:DNA-binding NarL/FixJ family response regulator